MAARSTADFTTAGHLLKGLHKGRARVRPSMGLLAFHRSLFIYMVSQSFSIKIAHTETKIQPV